MIQSVLAPIERHARGTLGRSRFSKREKIWPGGIVGGFLARDFAIRYKPVLANVAKMKKNRGMRLEGQRQPNPGRGAGQLGWQPTC